MSGPQGSDHAAHARRGRAASWAPKRRRLRRAIATTGEPARLATTPRERASRIRRTPSAARPQRPPSGSVVPRRGPELVRDDAVDDARREPSDEPTRRSARRCRTGPSRRPARCRRSSPTTATTVDDDLDAWATISGSQPRFRAEGSDWAEADFAEDLSGEHKHARRALRGRARSTRKPSSPKRSPSGASVRARAARAPRDRAKVAAAPAGAAPSEPSSHRPGPARGTRPADRDHDRGRGRRSSRSSASQSAHAATAVLAAVDRRRRDARVLRTRCSTQGLRPATLLALVASATLPLAAKHYGTDAYPVYFALIVVVLDAVVPVGDHAGPAAARRRDDRARVRVRRRARRFRRACCSRRHDGVGLILGVASVRDRVRRRRVLRRLAVRQDADRAEASRRTRRSRAPSRACSRRSSSAAVVVGADSPVGPQLRASCSASSSRSARSSATCASR